MCAESFGRSADNSCHPCEGRESLIAARIVILVVVLGVIVSAVAFLIGGLDAFGGLRRHILNLASLCPSCSQTSTIRISSGTELNRGEGAPPRSCQPATDFSFTEEATEAGDTSGNHHTSFVSPSARLYPNVVSSFYHEKESKSDDDKVHGKGMTCPDDRSEIIPAESDTTEVVHPRWGNLRTTLDTMTPENDCSPGLSTVLGCSTGPGAVHRNNTEHVAEDPESSGNKQRCRFGCYFRFGGRTKLLIWRLSFNKLKIMVVVWQILTVLPRITTVDFPPSYARFLSLIDVVNLDLGQIFSVSCLLPSVTFYERLLVTTLVPIVLSGVLVVTHRVARRKAGIGSRGILARRAAWSRHMNSGLLLSFLVSQMFRDILYCARP